MNFVERCFRLEALSGLGAKPRPELIGPVLTYLPDTLQDAVRMGFLHSSRARGRVPRGLKLAAEVRYLGHSQVDDDATLLRFEVPPFGDAAPDLFTQAKLWDDGPQIHDTAFELLGSALDDVVANRVDSNRYDTGLLQRISRYHRMFGKDGLRRIVIEGTTLPKPPSLDAAVIASAKALCDATPKPRRVRVAGRLDLIGASQGILEIHVETGHVVAALWDGKEPIDEIARFFNHEVVCEGMGVFRPSGSLLRVDVDAIALATPKDAAFSHVPRAPLPIGTVRPARLRPGETSAYSQFLGSVPTEESEAAFVAALEAMS